MNLLNLKLEEWMKINPNKTAFTELFSDNSRKSLTYCELENLSAEYGYYLELQGVLYDSKCLLIFEEVIEFVIAFLACERIGAVSVPVLIPEKGKDTSFWDKVIADAECDFILTGTSSKEKLRSMFKNIKIISRDKDDFGGYSEKKPNELLFVQYTSGSTGNPKGVMVTHSSLKANMDAVAQKFNYNSDSVVVSWLPYYHDLGLIIMLLMNIYCGSSAAVMMPQVFVANPMRWLEAVSEFKGTITGSPNFAYDLVAKTAPLYKGNLDLSSLTVSFSGGEPVQMNSMLRFYRSVKKYNISDDIILFGYGQAEATLVISVYEIGEKNRWVKVNREKFQSGKLEILEKGVFSGNDSDYETDNNEALYLVGNGNAICNHEITIREVGSEKCLPNYTIGEICFSGGSLSLGYYKNIEKTEEIFNYDSDGKLFLRTGDLGFLDESGSLFITGRIKDLIIINGENFYPQDVEAMVNEMDEAFYKNGVIAFSYQYGDCEKLVIVQELKKEYIGTAYRYNDVLCRIQSEVFKVFGIAPNTVTFVPENTLPRTVSGKLQRSKLKADFIKYGLRGIGQLIAYVEETVVTDVGGEVVPDIRSAISQMMFIQEDKIDSSVSFEQIGVTSVLALKLCLKLKEKYPKIEIKDIFERNTVNELAAYISTFDRTEKKVESEIETPFEEEFEMSAIQKAYHTGSNPELAWGGVDCYYACEFDVKSLDTERFRKALKNLVDYQPMLRCVKTEHHTQRICRSIELPLTVYKKVEPKDEYNHIQLIRNELKSREFKIGEPMFDIRLAEMNGGKYKIFLGISLFICDAYSILIFLEDLKAFYNGEEKAPLKSDYRKYIRREEIEKKSEKYKQDKEYWLGKIDKIPNVPKLPTNMLDGGCSKGRFVRKSRFIDKTIWSRFEAQAKRHNITPSMALLGVYMEVLKEYGTGTSFGIMATVMSREQDEENVIGEYTRLALLTANKREGTFFERVLKMQKQVQEDLSHLAYTPMELTKELRSRGKEAFYPVVFTSVLDSKESNIMEQLNWSYSQTPQVFIDFQAVSSGGGVLFSFDALEDLFYGNTLEEMFESLVLLTKMAAEDESFYDKELFDVRTNSQKIIQEKVNKTEIEWNKKLLLTTFLESWTIYAEKTAVICGDMRYTYRQLINRSAEYCNMLRSQVNWKNGERVMIQLPKTFDQIAAILGVLMAGGCYVPVQKDLGEKRVQHIMNRAKCSFRINKVLPKSEMTDVSFVMPDSREDDIAYIIFTSGSTGEPKGVPITHRQAMNTIYAVNKKFDIRLGDVFLAVSSVSFDLSVYDIFGCFAVFGTLVVPQEDERIDPKKLYSLIDKYNVTVYNSVPAIMEVLTETIGNRQCRSVKKILLSGDWISLYLPKKISSAFPEAKVYSLGGATEASIWSNYYPVTEVKHNWNSIPYGYPLENQKLFLFDKHLKPVPIGVKGRLFIAGEGIANGYFNDDERTRKSFITLSNGIRVYDTGDFGRYMEDGCIEFLGRQDEQVKINGYRIELGEIENAFSRIGIKERTIVLSIGEKMGDKHLVAFIESNDEILSDEIKYKLAEIIPLYCIPQSIISVYPLPLTLNGKCDKKKLISIYKSRSIQKGVGKVELSGDLARKITTIAGEVFGVSDILADTSFYEIGVASIDIIRFANRLDLEFGKRPTIQEMMSYERLSEIIKFYSDEKSADTKPKMENCESFCAYTEAMNVIDDEKEREIFAKQDIAYRFELSGYESCQLANTKYANMFEKIFEQSGTFRKEFLYSSLHNVYSVQVYIEIPVNDDSEFAGGIYYIDNRKRKFIRLGDAEMTEYIRIYTVADLEAAYPVYGKELVKHCAAEGGTIIGSIKVQDGYVIKYIESQSEEHLRKKLLLDGKHLLLSFAEIRPCVEQKNNFDAEKIIEDFKEKGITLFVEDEKLKFRAKEGAMNRDLKNFLKFHKEEIRFQIEHGKDYLPERYRPFGLTPIQRAYIVGRNEGYEIGGVNAHYYIEFETEHIEEKRFEVALNSLIRMHDMLKTVVYSDGTQRVLENVPYMYLKVTENADNTVQEQIRQKWRQRKYTLGEWPMFHIEISRCNQSIDRVHFSLDCILMDAYSAQKTIQDLFKLYKGENVSTPVFTFKKYLEQQDKWADDKGIKEKSEKFWNERLESIPEAPMLPYTVSNLSNIQNPKFERMKHIFSKEETKSFYENAKKHHVTENAVVTYCFMDTLSEMCGQNQLTLNLTMYSRYPLNKDVDNILGDFTNTSLLPYEKKGNTLDSIKAVGDDMMKAVEYNGCSGIELVKRLKDYGNESRIMPVVMTSMLHDSELTDFKEIYAVSCTPQVVLDGQAYYRSHKMILGFDYVKSIFNEKWIEQFFKRYIDKVKVLIASEDWSK